MAPPKTFAPAAVNPSSTLVRMGDMRKKDIRLRAVHRLPVETRLAASGLAAETGQSPSLHQILLLRFGRRANHANMGNWLQPIGWLACVVYSTIPAFWLMIHPFAERWRARHLSYRRSPYLVLLPAWMAIWIVVALATRPWRNILLYQANWSWGAAAPLFICGLYIYSRSGKNFSAKQLGGLPEVHGGNREQRLVTEGIRSRVRHPVYLAHLCEMLAWCVGTGLAVCWGLTAFAVLTGAAMIRMEDAELEKRFGDSYRSYRRSVPAVLPRAFPQRQL